MYPLRQGTATLIPFGQFIDKTDGATPETTITLNYVRIKKGENDWAAVASTTAPVHNEEGWYDVHLDATDLNTVGPLTLAATDEAVHLGVWRDYWVYPATLYDALYAGTAGLDVNLVSWLGVAPLTLVAQRVNASVEAMAADVLTAAALATDAGAEIADAVWDEARSGHLTAGTFGEGVKVELLNTQAKADMNAEVLDVVNTDTIPELAQAQPPATPTHREALMLLYMRIRNTLTESATEEQIHNAAGTVIAKATLSDDGTAFTKSVLTTGP